MRTTLLWLILLSAAPALIANGYAQQRWQADLEQPWPTKKEVKILPRVSGDTFLAIQAALETGRLGLRLEDYDIIVSSGSKYVVVTFEPKAEPLEQGYPVIGQDQRRFPRTAEVILLKGSLELVGVVFSRCGRAPKDEPGFRC